MIIEQLTSQSWKPENGNRRVGTCIEHRETPQVASHHGVTHEYWIGAELEPRNHGNNSLLDVVGQERREIQR